MAVTVGVAVRGDGHARAFGLGVVMFFDAALSGGCGRLAIGGDHVDGGADLRAGGDGNQAEHTSGLDGGDDASASGNDAGGAAAHDGGDGGIDPDGRHEVDPIPGLVSIAIAPAFQTVTLAAVAGVLGATAAFTATGNFTDGSTADVTARVSWPSPFASLRVAVGMATASAPGAYTITAVSGSLTGTATLVVSYAGSRYAPDFDPAGAATLDGAPGGATTMAYPLDHAIFPRDLGPIQVHIARANVAQTTARIHFSSSNFLDLSYYAVCQPGAGTGCYVDLPAAITQLFTAVSESHDIMMTARVGGAGAGVSLLESPPINVAWTNVPLSGALYYWTTLTDGAVPGYRSPQPGGVPTVGSGIQRYVFGGDVTVPELVYTDQGRSPTFYGSPPSTADGSTCIGCHAISGDGKTMALTIGGSGSPDFALLDLTTLVMTVLDPPAAGGATNLMDPNYYKQFRRSGIATETAFGPNGDVMVNMYQSGLVLRGTSASLANQGPVVPSWLEYKSDPFWSPSGKLFAFTSFAQPDVGTYNATGLNGDMKRGGQIMIATGGDASINDDARVLVARESNVTKFYPAVSDDDRLVVYDQSACGVDPDVYTNLGLPQVGVYGGQTCDGYDDSTASLWMTMLGQERPLRLDAANGGSANDNSFPRWSPVHGQFRGQLLYWVAFSSRRPYGLQINTGPPLTTVPQLWFAAVVLGSELFADPSRPAFWLPNQNRSVGLVPNQIPSDNHTPQWAKVAATVPQ